MSVPQTPQKQSPKVRDSLEQEHHKPAVREERHYKARKDSSERERKEVPMLNESNVDKFLNSFDAVFTDCDGELTSILIKCKILIILCPGVLWMFNEAIPGAAHCIQRLKNLVLYFVL